MRFEYFVIYFVVISAVSAFVCVIDKYCAVNNKWRIPEKTLFLLSIFGGAFAMFVTMYLIRHKTRHKRFMIGLPLIITSQILLTLFLSKVL